MPDEDVTPVRELTPDEEERLALVRDAMAARADREMSVIALEEAGRELAAARAEIARLEARNCELLEAAVERDFLREECDRLTQKVLRLAKK